MARKPKADGPGGFRGTQGRKSLFPGKDHLLTIAVTATAMETIRATMARLTDTKPRIEAAAKVRRVTSSDAVEYLIRRAAGVALED